MRKKGVLFSAVIRAIPAAFSLLFLFAAVSFPEIQNYQDAYLVLGQPSFYTRVENANGANAYKYNSPDSVFISTFLNKTFVVDEGNNRVLIYNSTNPATFQAADIVVGQPDMKGNSGNFEGNPSSNTLFSPHSVATWENKLIIADTNNHRVLIWNSIPTVNGQPADVVIGQSDFLSNTARNTPDGLYNPRSVAVYNGKLLIADTSNHRIAVFNNIPSVNDQTPDLFIGQEFVTPASRWEGSYWAYNYAGNNAYKNASNDSFSGPTSVFISTVAGKTFVAEGYNNRVLVYNSTSPCFYQQADLVLGQSNFKDNECNTAMGTGPNAYTMCFPSSVWSDGTKLVVTDETNNRVLIWNSIPTVNGQSADVVVGQIAMTLNSAGSSADKFNAPMSAWYESDSNQFFVTDWNNHRVQVFNGIPSSNGVLLADYSIGQNSPASTQGANKGGTPNSTTLYNPRSVTAKPGKLYVSDDYNNRVMVYNLPITGNSPAAAYVLGQPDFVTNTRCTGGISANSMAFPSNVFISSDTLFVSEGGGNGVTEGNNRILVFNTPITSNGQAASYVVGQPDFNTGLPNQGGSVGASTLYGWWNWPGMGLWASTSTLAVADASNHRVLYFSLPISANGPAAYRVLGQPSFLTNNSNRGGVSAGGLYNPYAVNVDQATGKVYVADTSNHRVLVWNSIPANSGVAADYVIGQATFTWIAGSQAYNWNGISASGMYNPEGVAAYDDKVYVADYSNNRVLIWISTIGVQGQPANASMGQLGQLNTNTANIWGSVTGFTLYNPRTVWAGPSVAWVVDRSNHRIMKYEPAPHAGGDDAADSVLGQQNYTTNSPNSGTSAAGLDFPQSRKIASDGNKIAVADTSNNRVLIWNSFPTIMGQSADIELGQPDMNSNGPNNPAKGAATMYNPVDVYYDGKQFFVADYGNNRVLVWNGWPATDAQPADYVVGQNGFAANATTCNGNNLYNPQSVHSDGNYLYVSDYSHYRVALYKLPVTTNYPPVVYVIGQAAKNICTYNAPSGVVNNGSLANIYDAMSDGKKLFISEYHPNNRVQIFDLPITQDRPSAAYVLGYNDFTISAWPNGPISPSTFYGGMGGFTDGQRYYLADYNWQRFLIWNKPVTANGQASDIILGQPNSYSGGAATTSRNFYYPRGSSMVGNKMLVTDYNNNRMMIFQSTGTAMLELSISSISPASALQGVMTPALRLSMRAPLDSYGFSGLSVFNAGNLPDSSIKGQIFLDDGSPSYPWGGQVSIEKPFVNGRADFDLNQVMDTGLKKYIVAVRILSDGLPYGPSGFPTTAVRVYHNFASLSFSTNTVEMSTGVPTGLPMRSGYITPVDSPDFVAFSGISKAPAETYSSASGIIMASLQLATTGDYAFIQNVVVKAGGTIDPQNEVTGVSLWQDNDGDSKISPGDVLVSSTQPFTSGTASLTLLSPLSVSTTPVNVLIAAVFSGNAQDKTFNIYIDSSSFSLHGLDLMSNVTTPFTSGSVLVRPAIPNVLNLNLSTGVWTNQNQVIFSGNFGQQGVFKFKYILDNSPTRTWTGTETDWTSGYSTRTFPSDGLWYFHVKAYNSSGQPGLSQDIGPFMYDASVPAGSAFYSLGSVGEQVGESATNSLPSGVTVQIGVQDILSGLAVSTGGFNTSGGDGHDWSPYAYGAGVVYSTNAGASWISGVWSDVNLPSANNAAALGVFNGKLYAGGATGLYERNGASWTSRSTRGYGFAAMGARFFAEEFEGVQYSDDGSSWIKTDLSAQAAGCSIVPRAVFKGKVLAAASSCGTYKNFASTDGINWTILPSDIYVGAMEVFKSILYIGGGTGENRTLSSSVDGSSWTVISSMYGKGSVSAMAVFNNKIYATGDAGKIYSSSDGSAWAENNLGVSISALAVSSGKLYAWDSAGGNLLMTGDGSKWLKENLPAGITGSALASFNGRLYLAGNSGKVKELTPKGPLSYAHDGETNQVILISSAMPLGISTTSAICGGSFPCGANNQIIFSVSDLAGNSKSYGPYAVLIDYMQYSSAIISTQTWPANGAYVNYKRSGFDWIGVSTVSAAIMGPSASYRLEIDDDPDFSSVNFTLSTPVVLADGNLPSADASVLSSSDLLDDTTYYWRVRLRTPLGNYVKQWSTFSFVTDFTQPDFSNYLIGSSTGGWVNEMQWIGLKDGVTVQANMSESGVGLVLSSTGLYTGGGDGFDWTDYTGGVGVSYTNDGGTTWTDGYWNNENDGNSVINGENKIRAMAVYNGKLYAGTGDSCKISVFDGNSWQSSNGGNPVANGETAVYSMAVYNGKLYVGTYPGAKVSVFDGNNWSAANSGNPIIPGESYIMSMAVYNGKLYAGSAAGSGKVAVFDGNVWRLTNGGNPVISGQTGIYSLAVYNGRLYAGTFPDGKVAVYGGTTWQAANSGNPIASGASIVYALSVYNGLLYAGVNGGSRVVVFDGSSWQVANGGSAIISGETGIVSLGVFGGKLYAGGIGSCKAAFYDGAGWRMENGGNSLVAGETSARTMVPYLGKLYVGTLPSAKVSSFSPHSAKVTGSDGVSSSVLVSTGINLIQSRNNLFCNGISPCSGTNQFYFNSFDRAGNVKTYGPYAVLVDTSLPSIAGFTLNSNNLSINISAITGSDDMAGIMDYSCEISPLSDFSSAVSSTPWNISNTCSFSNMNEGVNYYARTRTRDTAFNVSDYSVSKTTYTKGNVFMSFYDTAPETVFQGGVALMSKVDLWTNAGRSTNLNRLTVNKGTSTAASSDINFVKIYRDANGDGLLDLGDGLLGSGYFAGANTSVNINMSLLVNETTQTLLIAYEYNAAAVIDRSGKASFNAGTDFAFSYPFVANSTFPYNSSFTRIEDSPNNLLIQAQSLAPITAPSAMQNVEMLRLMAQTDSGSSILDKIRLYYGGDLSETRISAIKVYRDLNGNGIFDYGVDLLISVGNDVFVAGVTTITLTGSTAARTVNTTPVYFFLTADITSNAEEGLKFSVSIDSSTAFELSNPLDIPVLSPEPFTSDEVMIQNSNQAFVYITPKIPSDLYQGSFYTVALASVSVSNGLAQLNQIKMNKTGTAADSDIKSVRIYKDQILDGGDFNPVYDTMIGSGTFNSGVATIGISTVNVIYPSTVPLFIVYEISPLAVKDKTIGISFTNDSYFRFANANTSVVGIFPFSTSLGTIRQTVNQLVIYSAQDVTTGGVYEGSSNNPFLRIKAHSDRNTVLLSSIKVQKTGTVADSWVSYVKIYKDNGDDIFNAATDQLMTSGNDVFLSGQSNVSFITPQPIDVSTSVFYITLDLKPDAPYSQTLGVSVDTTDWIYVNSPNFISTNSVSAPYMAGPITINQYPNLVTVSTTNIVPVTGIYPGVDNVSVFKMVFKTDISKAIFQNFKLNKLGSLPDSAVKGIKIYYDSNNLGSFDKNNVAAYLLASSGTFDSQNVNLPISALVPKIDISGKTFFVVMDISTSASIGDSCYLRVLDNSYVTVSAPNTVAPLNFSSVEIKIMPPPQILTANFMNFISTYVTQGDLNVLVSSFTVKASSYSIDFYSLNIARTGSGKDTDASIKIYKDNGNGTWDGVATESLIGSSAFNNGVASVVFSSTQTINSGVSYVYYIVADVSETASMNKTFGIYFPSPGYFSVNSPHSVSASNFPFQSTLATINPTIDTLMVYGTDKGPGLKQGDLDKLIGKIQMKTDARSAVVQAVNFIKGGTTPDTDIKIRFFLDDGNASFGPEDTEIGDLSSLSAGSGVMVLGLPQTVTTIPKDYWVTVDISTLARVGSSFTLTASPTPLYPDVLYIDNSTITFTIAGNINDNPDIVYMDFTDLLSQSIYVGAHDTPVAKLTFYTLLDEAIFSSVKINMNGSGAGTDIQKVYFYEDTDGNGFFNKAYDVFVASSGISSGEAYFYLSKKITTAPRNYFVTIDVNSDATIGDTFTGLIPTNGNIMLEGVDVVDNFTGKATQMATIRDPRIPTPPVITVYRADGLTFAEDKENFNAYRTTVKFRWDSVANEGAVEGAYYYIGSAPADDTTPLSSWKFAGVVNEPTVSGLDLQNGCTYYLSVKTKNVVGPYYSDIIAKKFLVDTVIPLIDSSKITISNEISNIVVNWQKALVGISDISYYQVEEMKGNVPVWTAISTTSANYLSINDASKYSAGFKPQDAIISRAPGVYFYKITPVNNAGVKGNASAAVKVNVSIENLPDISDVSFYPNPFDARKESGKITFVLNQDAKVEILIYDVYGKKVRNFTMQGASGVNNIVWDGKNSVGRALSKGVYIALIKVLGTSVRVKIGLIH